MDCFAVLGIKPDRGSLMCLHESSNRRPAIVKPKLFKARLNAAQDMIGDNGDKKMPVASVLFL